MFTTEIFSKTDCAIKRGTVIELRGHDAVVKTDDNKIINTKYDKDSKMFVETKLPQSHRL